jgi:uncharacterized DUF497 family protein
LEVECDPLKAAENLAQHQVHFEDAARVFLDDRALKFLMATRRTVKIVGSP